MLSNVSTDKTTYHTYISNHNNVFQQWVNDVNETSGNLFVANCVLDVDTDSDVIKLSFMKFDINRENLSYWPNISSDQYHENIKVLDEPTVKQMRRLIIFI